MKKFFRNNGLSLVMFCLFGIFITLQFFVGLAQYNEELERYRQPAVSPSEYVFSGHFLEATFENWESEFFQMSIYVIFTAFLFQKGSSESNKLPEEKQDPIDREIERLKTEQKARLRARLGTPLPLKSSSSLKSLYKYSLSLTLGGLFLISWALQAYGGWKNENMERTLRGEITENFSQFLISSKFWFQTLQNWQSEFISVALLVVLSIYLRQEGSSQSKSLDAPHKMTEG